MPPRSPTFALLTILVTTSTSEAAADGEGQHKTARAVRVLRAPEIDGRLDDKGWIQAIPDDRFTQIAPLDGTPPTERTEFLLTYTDEALYVGIRMHDTVPSGIVSRLTRRDRAVESDSVRLAIDSYHDHSTAYVFQLNAAGVQADWFAYDDAELDPSWDAVWNGAVFKDDGGWSAEFEIPFSVLRFESARHQQWGLQVERYVSRTKERSGWIHIPSSSYGWVSRFGHLEGIADVIPAMAVELRPFAAVRVGSNGGTSMSFLGVSSTSDASFDATMGLDAKLGITSSLTLDATVFPDFGQVESDEVVLNLTRFESHFPEKRPFFLEGTDIFRTPISTFYSRRIGRSRSGVSPGDALLIDGERYEVTRSDGAVPIYAAGRLTGGIGGNTSFGVLTALTGQEAVTTRDSMGNEEELPLTPAMVFGVARLRHALSGPSYVGAMATTVVQLGAPGHHAATQNDAFTQGIDGQWQSSDGDWRLTGHGILSEQVGGHSQLTMDGRACSADAGNACIPLTRIDGTRLGSDRLGYGLHTAAQNFGEHRVLIASYDAFSPRLDINDLGFLSEFNRHQGKVALGYRQTTPKAGLRSFGVYSGVTGSIDFDGVPLEWGNSLHLEAVYPNYWSHTLLLWVHHSEMWDPYETGDGARFERKPTVTARMLLSTDDRRSVWVETDLEVLREFDGARRDASVVADVALRLLPQLQLDVGSRIGWGQSHTRFYDCVADGRPCNVDDTSRDYLFAELDSAFLSITGRGTFTLSPNFSVQAYAQLFLSRGEFSNYRSVATTMAERPYIEQADLAPSNFSGDFDMDGIKDDDFEDAIVETNLVARWEVFPGSTIIAAYSRTQDAERALEGRRPRFNVSGLFSGAMTDVFMVKATYFWR